VSATAIREKRQTTLPQDVSEAAGLSPGDQVDWRFEDGEIRGRKLVKSETPRRLVKPVIRHGLLVLPDLDVDEEALDREIRDEREQLNANLLG